MLVKTQDLGKTSVGELAATMGRVIPTAAAYNVSLDQLLRLLCDYHRKRHEYGHSDDEPRRHV